MKQNKLKMPFDFGKMVVFDFSSINATSKNNCFGCDCNCDGGHCDCNCDCDNNDCDCNNYCDLCDEIPDYEPKKNAVAELEKIASKNSSLAQSVMVRTR